MISAWDVWNAISSQPQLPPATFAKPITTRLCLVTFEQRTPQLPRKRAEMLCHPCFLGDPQQAGTKSEVAASPLRSWGPKRAQKGYLTPALSGIPNAKRREQNQKWSPTKGTNDKWLPHPCLLGGPKEGGNATSPLHSRGSATKVNKI